VVLRQVTQLQHDFLADAAALVIGVNGDIAEIRAVDSVRESSSGADQFSVVVNEASKHAVRKNSRQVGRLLVSERRKSIEVRQLLPVDRFQ
jgi:hypothetical protein